MLYFEDNTSLYSSHYGSRLRPSPCCSRTTTDVHADCPWQPYSDAMSHGSGVQYRVMCVQLAPGRNPNLSTQTYIQLMKHNPCAVLD